MKSSEHDNSVGNPNNGTATIPPPLREIRAIHDKDTIRVYQAYNHAIADRALEANSFRGPLEAGLWSKTRMTWIKPSKVWMAYRCGWTSLKHDPNQVRVLALDLSRAGFENLLRRAFVTSHNKKNDAKPGDARKSSVVVQWDPERYMTTTADKHSTKKQVYTTCDANVRSIQIGLRGSAVETLLEENFVLRISDVTQDFVKALAHLQSGDLEGAQRALWKTGQEREMNLSSDLRATLQMPPNRPQAIVVLGSAANPPHPGHLHCLEVGTRTALELCYEVIGTTVAIEPWGYVRRKMASTTAASFVLSDEERLNLLDGVMTRKPQRRQKGCQESTFHTTCTMEELSPPGSCSAALENFVLPDRAYGSALECGTKLRSSNEVAIVIVVGGDRAKQMWRKQKKHPGSKCGTIVTVCCARDHNQLQELLDAHRDDKKQGLVNDPNFHFISTTGPPVSSTAIREILLSKDEYCTARLLACGYDKATVSKLLQYACQLPRA